MTKFGKTILFFGFLMVLAIVVFLLQREIPVAESPVIENPIVDTTMPGEYDTTLVSGNKSDLVYLSIAPNTVVPKGILSYRGSVKGAYFFEANILINILDANLNVLKASNAVATTEWMTADPVEFEGNIDFTGLPAGQAYFEIHNDNASGLPENDKFIRIPILIPQ
ncbi:MAG: Gmad2 immunoglobulin-like domain-containing protein [Candidatus Paceibacterota bacterium]